MRFLSAGLLFVVLTATNVLAGESSSGDGYMFGIFRMFGSLAVVLGLIYLATHLFGKYFKGSGLGNSRGHIRVVETRHLSPKKSLILVEVAGEYLLLSNGADSVSFIKEIEMPEATEMEAEHKEVVPNVKGAFQEKIDGFMAKLQRETFFLCWKKGEE